MKKKLTFLLFGLLLTVGWTNVASAQSQPQGGYAERLGISPVGSLSDVNTSKLANLTERKVTPMQQGTNSSTVTKAPQRAATNPEMKSISKAEADQLFYTWTNSEGTHRSAASELATKPEQIYELLRFVYGNPAFPGPTYSAWTSNAGSREDPVDYGAVGGGWDITVAGSGTVTTQNTINITLENTYAFITSITVKSGNTEVTSWDCSTAGYTSTGYTDGNGYTIYQSTLTNGWTSSDPLYLYNSSGSTYYIAYISGGGQITIPIASSYTDVQVVIHAINASTSTATSISVNGESYSLTTDEEADWEDCTWNLTFDPQQTGDEFVQGTVQAPNEEGYTVLAVSLYNDLQLETESDPASSSHFENSADLIEYIGKNIKSVQLLTDGVRIGDNADFSRGTVFNCDGTYNRFFFLGKGQARKKAPRILERIANGGFQSSSGWVTYQDWYGEDVPFKTMFEQFSPTTAVLGDEITDFFSKMKEGSVYKVKHDCGSVLQAEHWFSLSGNSGTDTHTFNGMNFFVPDYRLMYWDSTFVYSSQGRNVDGRDNNPYQYASASGGHGEAFVNSTTNYSYWSCYYSNYNMNYAPLVGIYKITLSAEAESNGAYGPGNTFNVTLTWVSSLNEMSGHDVEQVYVVYLVDENGNRTELHPENVTYYDINGNVINEPNPFSVTQVVYAVPQDEHSYTITYIVKGTPADEHHPAFEAISNDDYVIIPGYKDFLSLDLDHFESDYIIAQEKNYYRNFLLVGNENEDNGVTVTDVSNAPNSKMKFKLYRWRILPGPEGGREQIATLTFDRPSTTQVHYKVDYVDENGDDTQEILDYTLKKPNGDVVKQHAYERTNMGIDDEGWLRVKGNGDIIIFPSGYNVNFKSIKVYNGNTLVASWQVSNGALTNVGWGLSPGSVWEPYTTDAGDNVYYVEGGGYIYIPNMLNTYNTLRVVINAYGDGASIARISVNDVPATLENNNTSYTHEWTVTAGSAKAPMLNGNNSMLTPYRSKFDSKIEGVRKVNATNN